MKTIKVTAFTPTDGIKATAHRKEKSFYKEFSLIVFDSKEFKTPISVRIYATSNTSYCCVWINDNKKGVHASGSGKASGYGYERGSCALEKALEKAGFTFDKHFGGTGEYEEAIESIAEYLGYKNYTIHKAHA